MIAYLSGLSVSREHHVLGQVFGHAVLVSPPPKERNQLRRVYSEQSIKRIVVTLIQELFGHFVFSYVRHVGISNWYFAGLGHVKPSPDGIVFNCHWYGHREITR